MQTIAATCLLAGFSLLLLVQSTQGQSCFCGNPNLPASSDRIVNGTQITTPHKYPWLARIIVFIDNGVLYCGGTVLSEKWVITTASCLANNTGAAAINVTAGSQIFVILGEHEFGSQAGQLPHYSIAKAWHNHPMYANTTIYNHDVALIELNSPFNYDHKPHIRPICLPTVNITENKNVTIAGWGLTAKGQAAPPLVPYEVMVNVTNDHVCNASSILNETRQWPVQNETMFCANFTWAGLCDGDYGGPVMYNMSGIFHLSGVVTFEQERGKCTFNETEPAVFTDILAPVIYTWITNVTENAGTNCTRN